MVGVLQSTSPCSACDVLKAGNTITDAICIISSIGSSDNKVFILCELSWDFAQYARVSYDRPSGDRSFFGLTLDWQFDQF
jgi:hypothetical protein